MSNKKKKKKKVSSPVTARQAEPEKEITLNEGSADSSQSIFDMSDSEILEIIKAAQAEETAAEKKAAPKKSAKGKSSKKTAKPKMEKNVSKSKAEDITDSVETDSVNPVIDVKIEENAVTDSDAGKNSADNPAKTTKTSQKKTSKKPSDRKKKEKKAAPSDDKEKTETISAEQTEAFTADNPVIIEEHPASEETEAISADEKADTIDQPSSEQTESTVKEDNPETIEQPAVSIDEKPAIEKEKSSVRKSSAKKKSKKKSSSKKKDIERKETLFVLPEDTETESTEPDTETEQNDSQQTVETPDVVVSDHLETESSQSEQTHEPVYFDLGDVEEKPSEQHAHVSESKPTLFTLEEDEEGDKTPAHTEEASLSESEIQQVTEQSEQQEEKIDHYDNTFLLEDEESVPERKSRLSALLTLIGTFLSSVFTKIVSPFRALSESIRKRREARKPTTVSQILYLNENGQIIPKQIIDSEGNKIEPLGEGVEPQKTLLQIIRDFFAGIKKRLVDLKELRKKKKAEKEAAQAAGEEVIYKSPLTRLKELAARIRERRELRKQQEEIEAAEAAEEYSELDRKTRSALRYRHFANSLMGIVVFFILLGALSGFSTIGVILKKTDVVLDISDIHNQDSTRIMDDAGELITIVGNESRISVSYASFPQVVVDAFVAIEDSRFFEHPGFDVPRFAKAFIENIKSLSFAQGGSTLTMQVIKNTYFAVDTIAEKGIDRKVQEIYYSLKINNIISKEKIFELYVNKVNFGATARGVQVASQYYFGKNCSELSLVEAAMLAGLVQAPNSNNPYYHLEESTKRTHEVLYQMWNHGYITDEEYHYADKVRIENLLIGTKEYEYGHGETVSYQAYVDIVLTELQEHYDINPYDTPVIVYTCMNRNIQDYCDEVSRGNIVKFPDEHINTTLVCIRNNTGELVGLCGGRDYDGKMMFNYAYDNRVNPGSTSKGIFTYPMAFENVPLATNHYIFDEPIHWSWTNLQIREDHPYAGDVSTQRAFTTSYNVVAVKLFQWVVKEKGMEVLQDYLRSIEVDEKVVQRMNEQYAIGMQNFLLSPIQLAGAESVILSHGVYYTPHTIRRIEFINSDKEPIECDIVGKQVLSEGAAWLTRYLQEGAVNGNGNADDWIPNGRLRYIKHSEYTVYGKTGTALYDKNIKSKYKWPENATKDYLIVGGTNDYTFSFWLGYDTGRFMDKTTYVHNNFKSTRPDGRMVNGLLDALYNTFGKPVVNNPMPDDVTTIKHIKGIYPYLKASAMKAPSATSYICKKHVNDETYTSKFHYTAPTKLENLKSFTATYNPADGMATLTWAAYPIADATKTGKSVKIVFDGKSYVLKRKFDTSILTGVVQYVATITNNATGATQEVRGSSSSTTVSLTNTSGSTVTFTIVGYYGYSKKSLSSNKITVTVSVPTQEVEPPVEPVTP